jgi:ribonuclease HI
VTAFGRRDLDEFTAGLSELRSSLGPPSTSGAYVAYTDGACLGNPRGPGGWAAVVFAQDQPTWRLFGHLSSTSNNRAEALGVLAALEWVPPGSRLDLYADSQLMVFQLRGVYKIKANTDIWELIQRSRMEKQLSLQAEWVRGHAGDPFNELADRLAKLGATQGTIDQLERDTPPSPPTEVDGLVPQGDWEREFLRSVRDQLRRGRSLSPKQQAIVDRMRARNRA